MATLKVTLSDDLIERHNALVNRINKFSRQKGKGDPGNFDISFDMFGTDFGGLIDPNNVTAGTTIDTKGLESAEKRLNEFEIEKAKEDEEAETLELQKRTEKVAGQARQAVSAKIRGSGRKTALGGSRRRSTALGVRKASS